MNFEWRVLTVGLAAFAAAGLVLAIVAPLLVRRIPKAPAALRARRLAHVRLLPGVGAMAIAAVVGSAFVLFEPRHDQEDIGRLAPALAVLGALVLGTALARAVRLALATRRAMGTWMARAERLPLAEVSVPAFAVDSAFPIVAVVGWRRPCLIIARSVLDECTPAELAAIVAHERGHLERRDNLRRLLLAAAPDVLAWLPVSRHLIARWRDAAEQAADDDAATVAGDGRAHLASALVKVARLAPAPPGEVALPASALYSGDTLADRVRRLLDPPAPAGPHRSSRPLWMAAAATAAIVSLRSLESVHAFVEVLIHQLP